MLNKSVLDFIRKQAYPILYIRKTYLILFKQNLLCPFLITLFKSNENRDSTDSEVSTNYESKK